MATAKDVATLAAQLMAEVAKGDGRAPSAETIAADAVRLHRIAGRILRWRLAACNGIERYDPQIGRRCASWTEADEAAKDRAIAKAMAEAGEIAARYGATVTTQGDPRGTVLFLRLASGRANGWTDGAWGIR